MPHWSQREGARSNSSCLFSPGGHSHSQAASLVPQAHEPGLGHRGRSEIWCLGGLTFFLVWKSPVYIPRWKKPHHRAQQSQFIWQFVTSVALESSQVSNALEIFCHNGLFSPKPRLIIRSPGISPGSVGTTKAAIQIKLWTASWRAAKASVRLNTMPSPPWQLHRSQLRGLRNWEGPLTPTHIPAMPKAASALVNTDRSAHTPWEQPTCTQPPMVIPGCHPLTLCREGGQ